VHLLGNSGRWWGKYYYASLFAQCMQTIYMMKKKRKYDVGDALVCVKTYIPRLMANQQGLGRAGIRGQLTPLP